MGEPEVDDFDVKVGGVVALEKNILEFEIAMSNLATMQVGESIDDLEDNLPGHGFRHGSPYPDVVHDLASPEHISNNIVIRFILYEILWDEQLGMRNPPHYLQLALQ